MLITPGWTETSEKSTATTGGETSCNHSSLQGGEVSWRGEKPKLKLFPFFVFEEFPFFRLRRISWWCSRLISVLTDVTDYLCPTFDFAGYWSIETRIGESGSKETQTVAGLRTRSLDVLEKSVKGGILSSKCLLAKVTKWKMWRVWMTIANQLLNFVPDSGSHLTCTV